MITTFTLLPLPNVLYYINTTTFYNSLMRTSFLGDTTFLGGRLIPLETKRRKLSDQGGSNLDR